MQSTSRRASLHLKLYFQDLREHRFCPGFVMRLSFTCLHDFWSSLILQLKDTHGTHSTNCPTPCSDSFCLLFTCCDHAPRLPAGPACLVLLLPQATCTANPGQTPSVLVKLISTDPGYGRRSYYRSPLLLGLPQLVLIIIQILNRKRIPLLPSWLGDTRAFKC